MKNNFFYCILIYLFLLFNITTFNCQLNRSENSEITQVYDLLTTKKKENFSNKEKELIKKFNKKFKEEISWEIVEQVICYRGVYHWFNRFSQYIGIIYYCIKLYKLYSSNSFPNINYQNLILTLFRLIIFFITRSYMKKKWVINSKIRKKHSYTKQELQKIIEKNNINLKIKEKAILSDFYIKAKNLNNDGAFSLQYFIISLFYPQADFLGCTFFAILTLTSFCDFFNKNNNSILNRQDNIETMTRNNAYATSPSSGANM